MTDPIISQWVYATMDGDQDAFAEIVYTFQDAVYNLCYRMLSDSLEAEDAAQEVFLRAFSNLHRYDHSRAFKTWLLTIASNHCIDRIRKRRMTFVSIDEPIPATLSLSSDDPMPEQAVLLSDRSERVQKLLDELSPDYRVAVVLRYWYDYSYAEIADIMDTTESAIKSRLHRARRILAEKIGPSGTESGDRISSLLEEG